MTEVPIQALRNQLSELLGRCRDLAEQFTVTVAGEAAAVLVNPYRFEAMVETLEILNDPKLVADLAEAENDAEVYTSEDVLSEADSVSVTHPDAENIFAAANSDRQLQEDITDDGARLPRGLYGRGTPSGIQTGERLRAASLADARVREDDERARSAMFYHDQPVAGHPPTPINPFRQAEERRFDPEFRPPAEPHSWTVEMGSGRMTYAGSAPAQRGSVPSWEALAEQGWAATREAAGLMPASAPEVSTFLPSVMPGPEVIMPVSEALAGPTVVQPTLPRPSFKDLSGGFDEPDLPDLCNRIARGMTTFSGYRRAWENLSPVEQKTVVDIAIAAIRIGNGNAGYSRHRRYWADLPSEIQNDAVREALRTWGEGNLYVGPTTRSPDVSEASDSFPPMKQRPRIDDEKVTRHRRKGLRELSSAVRQITGSRSDE